ncbi:MAG: Glucose-6-phosphate isomerase [Anaerolineae bacterium]|jgi:glucose-6-phosphate isomerase|nr:MAG: Glucose-6-phosphate isomerase [Anaerolineae bacterium]
MNAQHTQWINETLEQLQRTRVIPRLWAHDHTLWSSEPTEITNRLGWLHCTEWMPNRLHQLTALVKGLQKENYRQAVLLGMGGSSLAPQVFRQVFGVQEGFLDLRVIDTTDPDTITREAEHLDYRRTIFIVSTKSGGTVETFSLFRYFYNRCLSELPENEIGAHFLAITDPGSTLAELAEKLRFRALFLNDPNIGGRYSALSLFGMLPAALVGVDLHTFLEQAAQAVQQSQEETLTPECQNPAAMLGAAIGAMALHGKDKITFLTSPSLESFGDWVEQLLAESSGKSGKGILPVVREPVGNPEEYGSDRFFVYLRLNGEETYDNLTLALQDRGHPVLILPLAGRYNLAEQFFYWEMATAIACHLLGVHPFDQPNVEETKALTRQLIAAFREKGKLTSTKPDFYNESVEVFGITATASPDEALQRFLAHAAPPAYIAIQAFLPYTAEIDQALQTLRAALRRQTRCAVTLGYGPRYLHSTGQLHKGDAGNGTFVQFTCDPQGNDLPIPDEFGSSHASLCFGDLKLAQALGDQQALLNQGRRVLRFHLKKDLSHNILSLIPKDLPESNTPPADPAGGN